MGTQAQAGKGADELDAMRAIVEAAEPFDPVVRRRIFRYAADRLGLEIYTGSGADEQSLPSTDPREKLPQQPVGGVQDIRSFLSEKNPRADTHKAVAVAYYFRFVAPESERKAEISGPDLQNAMRLAGMAVYKDPFVPLNNAVATGLLDRPKKGMFSINSVGENLVAMLLPNGGASSSQRRVRARAHKNGKSRKG